MRSAVEEVEGFVARMGTHPVWGYEHCLRVHAMAEYLAAQEGLDHNPETLRLAALLHDAGLYKAYALREAPDHARRSADVAGRLLRDLEFPEQKVEIVLDAINHHPPGTPAGKSTEAHLLGDAVALDYLGAIGVSRVLAMVGLEEDVPNLAAAVRHARSLHQNVPGLLVLHASRDVARQRVVETDDFLRNLGADTGNFKLL